MKNSEIRELTNEEILKKSMSIKKSYLIYVLVKLLVI